jgi:hypothetical protein
MACNYSEERHDDRDSRACQRSRSKASRLQMGGALQQQQQLLLALLLVSAAAPQVHTLSHIPTPIKLVREFRLLDGNCSLSASLADKI